MGKHKQKGRKKTKPRVSPPGPSGPQANEPSNGRNGNAPPSAQAGLKTSTPATKNRSLSDNPDAERERMSIAAMLWDEADGYQEEYVDFEAVWWKKLVPHITGYELLDTDAKREAYLTHASLHTLWMDFSVPDEFKKFVTKHGNTVVQTLLRAKIGGENLYKIDGDLLRSATDDPALSLAPWIFDRVEKYDNQQLLVVLMFMIQSFNTRWDLMFTAAAAENYDLAAYRFLLLTAMDSLPAYRCEQIPLIYIVMKPPHGHIHAKVKKAAKTKDWKDLREDPKVQVFAGYGHDGRHQAKYHLNPDAPAANARMETARYNKYRLSELAVKASDARAVGLEVFAVASFFSDATAVSRTTLQLGQHFISVLFQTTEPTLGGLNINLVNADMHAMALTPKLFTQVLLDLDWLHARFPKMALPPTTDPVAWNQFMHPRFPSGLPVPPKALIRAIEIIQKHYGEDEPDFLEQHLGSKHPTQSDQNHRLAARIVRARKRSPNAKADLTCVCDAYKQAVESAPSPSLSEVKQPHLNLAPDEEECCVQ